MKRPIRGGGCYSSNENLRIVNRSKLTKTSKEGTIGLRLVKNVEKTEHEHVLRGGSWYVLPNYLRSTNRNWDSVQTQDDDIGFRLVKQTTLKNYLKELP